MLINAETAKEAKNDLEAAAALKRDIGLAVETLIFSSQSELKPQVCRPPQADTGLTTSEHLPNKLFGLASPKDSHFFTSFQ